LPVKLTLIDHSEHFEYWREVNLASLINLSGRILASSKFNIFYQFEGQYLERRKLGVSYQFERQNFGEQ
jgi:hypothetical protein